MDETRFDQSVKVLEGAAGRRDAVRALGAAGMAVLAALGVADASAKQRNNHGNRGGNKHRNQHRSQKSNRNDTRRQPHGLVDDTPVDPADEIGDPGAGAPEQAPDATTEANGAVQAERKKRGKKKRGPVGPTGPMGPAGPAGGPAGSQGPTGPTGQTGPTGPPGQEGPQAPQGSPGATGPAGPTGQDGQDGQDGAPGPTGPTGPAATSGAQTATVAGADTITSVMYTDLPGVSGPAVTVDVPASGRVLVTVTATIEPWALGDFGSMSFASSGGSGADVTAGDQRALIYHRETTSTLKPFRASATHLVTVGANTTKAFTAKYRTGGVGGGTATFFDRDIIAIPLP